MIRLNLVLLLAVIVSALYLVRTQYESRRLFSELDRAHTEARKLDTEHEQLEADKRVQATPARVQQIARERLQMRNPTPAITQYVTVGTVKPAAAGAPP